MNPPDQPAIIGYRGPDPYAWIQDRLHRSGYPLRPLSPGLLPVFEAFRAHPGGERPSFCLECHHDGSRQMDLSLFAEEDTGALPTGVQAPAWFHDWRARLASDIEYPLIPLNFPGGPPVGSDVRVRMPPRHWLEFDDVSTPATLAGIFQRMGWPRDLDESRLDPGTALQIQRGLGHLLQPTALSTPDWMRARLPGRFFSWIGLPTQLGLFFGRGNLVKLHTVLTPKAGSNPDAAATSWAGFFRDTVMDTVVPVFESLPMPRIATLGRARRSPGRLAVEATIDLQTDTLSGGCGLVFMEPMDRTGRLDPGFVDLLRNHLGLPEASIHDCETLASGLPYRSWINVPGPSTGSFTADTPAAQFNLYAVLATVKVAFRPGRDPVLKSYIGVQLQRQKPPSAAR
jgi:hypothetical protein